MRNFINHIILNQLLCLRWAWRGHKFAIATLISVERLLWTFQILYKPSN
jgi:hypothetical protein